MTNRPSLYTCKCGRIFGAEYSGDIGVDADFLPLHTCDECLKKEEENNEAVHMA